MYQIYEREKSADINLYVFFFLLCRDWYWWSVAVIFVSILHTNHLYAKNIVDTSYIFVNT